MVGPGREALSRGPCHRPPRTAHDARRYDDCEAARTASLEAAGTAREIHGVSEMWMVLPGWRPLPARNRESNGGRDIAQVQCNVPVTRPARGHALTEPLKFPSLMHPDALRRMPGSPP